MVIVVILGLDGQVSDTTIDYYEKHR